MRSGGFAAVVGLGALVVWGVIVADIWSKPAGTQAASSGIVGIERPALNALLGSTS